MIKKLSKLLDEIKPVSTAHGTGVKQIFLSNDDTDSKLTQFAYGTLKPGEGCKRHIHKTMDEYFFFLKGNGVYMVCGNQIKIQSGMFLNIPANKEHWLQNNGKNNLEFVYFGVAIEKKI